MKLNDTQLSQVDAQIKRLVKTDSYYGKKYRELGITDVTSQEAFLRSSLLENGSSSNAS